MNAYMVVMRQSMDDVPLLLTADRSEAETFAKAVDEDDGKQEGKILAIDISTPICVSLWTFHQGKLVKSELMKDFAG